MDTKEKARTGRQVKRGAGSAQKKQKPAQQQRPSGNGAAREEARRKAAEQEKRRAARAEQEKRRRQAAQREREKREAEKKRRAAQRTPVREKKKPRPQRTQTPEVIYTPPKPFNSAAFLLRLATVVAVVISLIFGVSIFFRVDTVNVSGTEKYTPWVVMQASGIKEGDNLLTLAKARVSGRITAALPYVGSVRVEIQLPDTVNIAITELDVVYAIRDDLDGWWLMTCDGRVVEAIDEASAAEYTQIQGVLLTKPAPNQQAVAAQGGEDTVTQGSDRLAAALSILQNLERNGIIGDVDSVNVENPGSLEMWYGKQYLVKLGDTSRLEYKISCMSAAVKQMNDYRSGVLDISFTVWPDQPGYTPFNED